MGLGGEGGGRSTEVQYRKDGNGEMIRRERLRISEEQNVDTVQYILSIHVC